jgi:hypothetical protein
MSGARGEEKAEWKHESHRWTVAQTEESAPVEVWVSENDKDWDVLCELKAEDLGVYTPRSGPQKGKKYIKFSSVGVYLSRPLAVICGDTPKEIQKLLTDDRTYDHTKVKGKISFSLSLFLSFSLSLFRFLAFSFSRLKNN